jgi:hypothetical protein
MAMWLDLVWTSKARCYAKHATWSIIMVKLASEQVVVMRESRMQG